MDINLNRSIFRWLMITNILLIILLVVTNTIWVISWVNREKDYSTIITTEETKTVEDIDTAGDIIQY